jgi:hypothetical protein
MSLNGQGFMATPVAKVIDIVIMSFMQKQRLAERNGLCRD